MSCVSTVSSIDEDRKGFKKREELQRIEKWAQEKWDREKAFEVDAPDVSQANKPAKFMATFPFPYMNGKLHLGHSFTLSKVEFAVGFERLQGKRALFPFGFHCTGMPIKACADKLKREVEMFGRNFEGYSQQKEREAREAALEAAQEKEEAKAADPTKIVKKHSKAAAKASGHTFQFQILESVGVPKSEIYKFADANHWLTYFPPIAREDMKSFGLKVDWRRSFITTEINPYFDSFVRWQFNKLHAKNRIKFGERFTIFSPLDNQACMDHDRQSGEGVGVQEYTGIKLKILTDAIDSSFTLPNGRLVGQFFKNLNLGDRAVYLVAGTLRPETMYGQTNCYVGPSLVYGIYEVSPSEAWVCTERAAKNMAWQNLFPGKPRGEYNCLGEVQGVDLIGLPLSGPLSFYKKIYCLPMESVLPDKGTGVVTSVPSDSPDDFVTLRDLNKKPEYYKVSKLWTETFNDLKPIIDTPTLGNLAAVKAVESMKIQSPKDRSQLAIAKEAVYKEGFHQGHMLVGEYAGRSVSEAKPLIRERLIEQKLAFTYCEPEGVVISRSGDECVVTLCDQWFLEYGNEEWKAKAKACLERMETFAPETRATFERTLDWLHDWACSRSYGLGSHLPWDKQWLIESLSDSTIYMAYYTVAHFLQYDAKELSLDGRNSGLLNISAEAMSDEVWDYIFNLGPLPKDSLVPVAKLDQMRNEFAYFYPLDLRCSGKDLVPNHLTFFLYNHCDIFPQEMWPKGVRANGHLLLNGEKMSKSTGNFMTMSDAVRDFGADATRFALADAGDGLDDANFVADIANAAILRLYTQLEFAREICGGVKLRDGEFTWNDRVFEAEMNDLVLKCEAAYKKTLYRDAIKYGFYDFQSMRDRYRETTADCGGMHGPLVKRWLEYQAILLAPVCTHWSEYVYSELLKQTSSVLAGVWPTRLETDDSLLLASAYIKGLVHDVRSREEQAARKAKKKSGVATPTGISGAEDVKKKRLGRITVATKFPEWQEAVFDVLRSCYDHSTKKLNGKEVALVKERGLLKNKKVMPFLQMHKRAVESEGISALDRTVKFDELDTLSLNKTYIQRCLDLASLDIILAEEVQHPSDLESAENATPGHPVCRIWLE